MVDPAPPALTIVIPSHNRASLLRQMLDCLEQQSLGGQAFECVVVADGCQDDTIATLQAAVTSFPLRWLETPGLGPSAARNAGAGEARTPLLLFLDDDVLPTPGLVAAHLAAHGGDCNGDRVVLGPYPPVAFPSADQFRMRVRAWWMAHFEGLADPGHRFGYTDLLTGNLSMGRALWLNIGGLDPQFARAREDLELGVRLMQRGVRIHYASDALGWHHEHLTSSLTSAFRRAREEGRSDVLMAIKHPHIAPTLAIARWTQDPAGRKSMALARIGWLDWFVPIAPTLLRLYQWLGLRKAWGAVYSALHGYCYRRGALSVLRSGQELPKAIVGSSGDLPLVIDLADGMPAAERMLDAERPQAVRLMLGAVEIGFFAPLPGFEPWAGRHLRAQLAGTHARAMISALLAQRGFAAAPGSHHAEAMRMIGVSNFVAMWGEQRRQWARAKL